MWVERHHQMQLCRTRPPVTARRLQEASQRRGPRRSHMRVWPEHYILLRVTRLVLIIEQHFRSYVCFLDFMVVMGTSVADIISKSA